MPSLDLYVTTPALFLMPNDQSKLLILVFGRGVSRATEEDRLTATALVENWRKRGYRIACGCRRGGDCYPLLSVVFRNGQYHLRHSNVVAHTEEYPLSLRPTGSSRRPNIRIEVRLREIATRLRPWVYRPKNKGEKSEPCSEK